MGSLIAAWLVGESIIVYRSVKKNHAPPIPGELLIASGVFALLGLLAESDKARVLAVTLAWGYDLAAFMDLSITKPPSLVTGNVVPWPPATAGNTVIFPDGKAGSANSSSAPTSQAPATTPRPTGPVSV